MTLLGHLHLGLRRKAAGAHRAGRPPAPPLPPIAADSNNRAAAKAILENLLHAVHPSRVPSAAQRRALQCTITSALEYGMGRTVLQTLMARWDASEHTLAYPLIRARLYAVAPRAGYDCPHCGEHTTGTDARRGLCADCNNFEGEYAA